MSASLHNSGLTEGASAHDGDERWALVLRVSNSRQLVKAQQLRDILLYICNRALSSDAPVIREHEIAREVLGRRADFNPHEDNIVRVQISHLRKRLEEYFATQAHTETVRLTIPKGSYVPKFEALVRPAPAIDPLQVISAPPVLASRPAIGKRWLFGLVCLGASILMTFTYWLRDRGAASATRTASAQTETTAHRFWAGFFKQPANVVVADTCLVMLQDILDQDIPLADYLNGRYPEILLARAKAPALQAALRTIASRQYTSLADINTAAEVIKLSRQYSSTEARIRYARYLNVRDFKSGNFILMGSRRGIPWVRLFEPQLNFSMEEDPATKVYYFRNLHPKPGEQDAYRPQKDGDNVVETYADVAIVPNLSGTGYVMMLSGIGMESSESAGELVTGPQFSNVLSSLPSDASGLPPTYFELLLRTRAVGGAARNSEVVTLRVLHATQSSVQ